MRLARCSECDAPFPDEFGVHVHDDVVVLADHAEPAFFGQHLKRFPDIAEIDHAAAARGKNIGGEYLEGRITGLDRFGELTTKLGPGSECSMM